ncbi:hypothetical protein ACFSVJ_26860 [Prauserella oleivorans]
MLCVAREIGNQIEDCLRASSRPQDLALALSFMRYTNSSRPTVVIDEQSMLANTPALPYVSVGTHVLLWETLNAEDWKREGARRLRLDEVPAEVLARRVLAGPKVHFVLHFDDRTEPTPPDAHASAAGDAVVASARRAVRDLAKEVIVVEGPAGLAGPPWPVACTVTARRERCTSSSSPRGGARVEPDGPASRCRLRRPPPSYRAPLRVRRR